MVMNKEAAELFEAIQSLGIVEDWAGGVELVITSRPTGLTIKIAAMYRSPKINFPSLKKLSDIFGTDNIDVDDFEHRGCETCDYGSSYGHDIVILDITKHKNDIEQLIKFVEYLKYTKG